MSQNNEYGSSRLIVEAHGLYVRLRDRQDENLRANQLVPRAYRRYIRRVERLHQSSPQR